MRNLLMAMLLLAFTQSHALEVSDCMQIIDKQERTLCVDDVVSKQRQARASSSAIEVYKCKNPDGITTMSFGMPCKNGGAEVSCDKPREYYSKKNVAGTSTADDRACLAKLGVQERFDDAESARIAAINKENRTIAEAKAAGLFIVDYEVLAPELASLTYTNQDGSTEQHDVNPPWRLRLTEPAGFHAYISAQNESGYGSVIVRLYVNGIQVKTAQSSTKYGIATASGRL